MRYNYTNFIKQNIAPKGATSIVVFNSNTMMISIGARTKTHGLLFFSREIYMPYYEKNIFWRIHEKRIKY